MNSTLLNRPFKTADTKWEGFFLLLSGACMSGALVALVYLSFQLIYIFHEDYLTFSDAASAIGSVMAGFAGSLFAFATGLLFYLTYRTQVKQYRQAAVDHKETLTIMKHEKDFHVVLAAIAEVRSHLFALRFRGYSDYKALEEIGNAWKIFFKKERVLNDAHTKAVLNANPMRPEDVLPSFDAVDELYVQMYWVLHSLRIKALDARDTEFLHAMISPIIRDVSKAIGLSAARAAQRAQELIDDTAALQNNGIADFGVKYYLGLLTQLNERQKLPPSVTN